MYYQKRKVGNKWKPEPIKSYDLVATLTSNHGKTLTCPFLSGTEWTSQRRQTFLDEELVEGEFGNNFEIEIWK